MIMKLKLILPILSLLGLLSGFAYQRQSLAVENVERVSTVANWGKGNVPTILNELNSVDEEVGRVSTTANWGNIPTTLRELYDSAD
ncbi:hypothetical protein MNBD_CHLOROFLEXI01-1833, partial [hydrothermal vent metagenome]